MMAPPGAKRTPSRLSVPVRGVSLQVSERGSGTPTLFQHGLGAAAEQVDGALDGIDGLRLVTVECRGHGGSPLGAERPFSMPLLTSDVMAAADALGLPSFLAGGISMGAAIALRLAVRHPERVRALVLLRPTWLWDDAEPPALAPLRAISACLRHGEPAGARRAFLASEAADALRLLSPGRFDKLLHWFDRPDPQGTAALLGDLAGGGSGVSARDAGSLALPALVVAQQRDSLHPVEVAETLAGTIPGARLVVVPALDEASKVNRRAIATAVARFLDDHRDVVPMQNGRALETTRHD